MCKYKLIFYNGKKKILSENYKDLHSCFLRLLALLDNFNALEIYNKGDFIETYFVIKDIYRTKLYELVNSYPYKIIKIKKVSTGSIDIIDFMYLLEKTRSEYEKYRNRS